MSLVFASRSRIIGTTYATSSLSRWLALSANKSSSCSSSSSSSLLLLRARVASNPYNTFSTVASSVAATFGHTGGGDHSSATCEGEAEKAKQKTKVVAVGEAIPPFQTSPLPENASSQFHNGKPTLAYARSLPKTFATMTNDQVIHFGELGVPEACRECIVRDIMMVDNVEYDEALQVFHKIAKTNREDMSVAALPFYTGVFVSVTAGYVSIPLVFHRGIVEWFNEKYVTAEMPPVEDLETWLEVGSVAWSWMEPVLGQVSFFILCMQMARSQLQNLGIRPYFHWQQERRATKLVRMYPQYDSRFLANFSRCDQLAEPRDMSD